MIRQLEQVLTLIQGTISVMATVDNLLLTDSKEKEKRMLDVSESEKLGFGDPCPPLSLTTAFRVLEAQG